MTKTPYFEKMKEQLSTLPLESMSRVEVQNGTAESFKTAGIEKAALAEAASGGVHFSFCTIFPAEGYDLPLFFSRWQEREKEISMLVDIIPTVDSLVDEPYRKKYIEPMGELWDRFSSLEGIWPEEHDELRSACSIIYTAAKVPVERDGMRLAALAPHIEYLKRYCGYALHPETVNDTAKQAELKRKAAAVKLTLQRYYNEIIRPAITAEAGGVGADKLFTILF